jgi:hypothetical protein
LHSHAPSDFYNPFIGTLRDYIRAVDSGVFLFLEPVPQQSHAVPELGLDDKCAYAPHWYDLKCLFEKRWSPYLSFDVQALSRGSRNVIKHMYLFIAGTKRNYTTQMSRLFENCAAVPRLIGETGIPMDMNRYFDGTCSLAEPFQQQTQALDCVITACERNLLPYCLWNYTPENIEGQGDFWNREDLSIFSSQKCVNSTYGGARALRAFIRPGAIKVAGIPIKSEFDLASGLYTLIFLPDHASHQSSNTVDYLSRQTEIFIPNLLTSDDSLHNHFLVSIKCGSATYECVQPFPKSIPSFRLSHPTFRFNRSSQTFLLWHSENCSSVHLELKFTSCSIGPKRPIWLIATGMACAAVAFIFIQKVRKTILVASSELI